MRWNAERRLAGEAGQWRAWLKTNAWTRWQANRASSSVWSRNSSTGALEWSAAVTSARIFLAGRWVGADGVGRSGRLELGPTSGRAPAGGQQPSWCCCCKAAPGLANADHSWCCGGGAGAQHIFGTVGARSSVMHGAHTGCERTAATFSAIFFSNQRIAGVHPRMPDYSPRRVTIAQRQASKSYVFAEMNATAPLPSLQRHVPVIILT